MAALSVVVVLAVLRVAAPWLLRRAINDRLARIPDYSGHVQDVDVSVFRGAYALDGIELRKRGGDAGAPLFAADRVDFSVKWGELFRGRILSEIQVEGAKITFVRTASEESGQTEVDRRWQDVVQDVFPISIARLQVEHAELEFVDRTRQPDIDIALHDLRIVAEGLRNRRATSDQNDLPAALYLWGHTVGDGTMEMRLRMAPLETQPLFHLELAVRQLPLPAYNSLLRAYANVDVSRGLFDLSLEVAAREGAFEGYVKPFFRDLDFENITDRERPMLGRLWESIVNVMNDILKNPERHRLGTRVPFSGTFENTEVGTWTAVVNAVRYGFGSAFSEAVEGTLEPRDVETSGGDTGERR